ncbi:hypothetical protein BGZ94_002347 [Podila epigama]|nr:hypothetical protein BGZ94_002347 [Podila epigama]
MTNKWILYCKVVGETTAFHVDIDPDLRVSHLKDDIKYKKAPEFNTVAADKLMLWSTTVPDDKPGFVMTLESLEKLKDTTKLDNPKTQLRTLFPDGPNDNTYIFVKLPELVQMRIEKIKNEFFQQGTAISDFLRRFVHGEVFLPEADCCVKGLPKAWLRSSSFSPRANRPALYLLHPTKPHNTTSTGTPPSVAALEMILKFPNNDLITFFGVSGCGKTRAAVEMLAQTWGFYLNSSQADRGSKDVATLFYSAFKMPNEYLSSDRVRNGLKVQAMTACLLLARLLVLQHCLSLGRYDIFTSERWMLLQVCPGAFESTVPDVFDQIFRAVLDSYHKQEPAIPLLVLENIVQDKFRLVQELLSSYASDSRSSKFLVVLDEAQTLSEHGKDFFVSRSDSKDLRSILSPIVHGLRNISSSAEDYCVVTCGTGIGADELDILLSSGGIGITGEQVNRRIVDFPGWESVDQVAMYIRDLGDRMSTADKATLDALLPQEAILELFSRLRGRFRPLVSAIEEIIADGLTSCWKDVIDKRVDSLVCYPESFPVRGNLCSDIKRMLDKVSKDPVNFKDSIDIRHVLKQTVVFRASTGLPCSLRGEEPILVESAVARLRLSADLAAANNKTLKTVIDEPFVFQAAYNFVKNEEKGFYNNFREQYQSLQDASSEGKLFERHAPLDLIHAFHKKRLKRELFSIPKPAVHKVSPKKPIPTFEPVTFPRHLFEHSAAIVGWEGYEWGARYKVDLTMRDFLDAHYHNKSRKDGCMVPPFFYPEQSRSGPDIVFVLRINNELYPVFVQTKLLDKIYPGDVEEARLTVHEDKIKNHLPNLATYCPRGKYLSLIYAYASINKTPRDRWDSDALWDKESESGTNRSHYPTDIDRQLMQLLMIIDGSNMRDFMPEGVVELLDSVKGTKRLSDQPHSSDRAKKKTMLEKQ